MARIAIRNGERVRECEEVDFPHFAARGFVKVVADAPAPQEGETQAEPVKNARKRK